MRFFEELTTEDTESTEFFQKRVLKALHSRKAFALGIAGLFLISVAQAVEPDVGPASRLTSNDLPAGETPALHSRSPQATGFWYQSVDALDEAQVQKALEAVRANFLSAELLDKASQRALLKGLILQLGPGVSIVEADAKPEKAGGFPFLAEILDGRAGYIRPGSLDSAALKQMDSALGNFREKSIGAVILDLRGMPSEADFEACAEFARRFCPKGSILFTVQKPNAKQERIVTDDRGLEFEGVLVVLVDSGTGGAAEVLAATLRDNARAMVVGEKTAGEAVEFAGFPVGGGRSVRVAVSQVLAPKGGVLFPGGVEPDISVRLDRATRDAIFEKAREEGVSRFAFDVEPPRMNEAALVANTNPEIGEDRSAKSEPALRDTVLQRALDLVTAIGFFKK